MSFSLECLFLWREEAILNDSFWHRLHSELTGVSFDKGLSSLSLPGLVWSRVSEDGKTYWVCAAEPRWHGQGTGPKGVFQECSLDQMFTGMARNHIICWKWIEEGSQRSLQEQQYGASPKIECGLWTRTGGQAQIGKQSGLVQCASCEQN